MAWLTTRGNRIKGERKGVRYQSSGHLRHGNSCSALSVINSIRHRITSSQSWVYILFFFTWWFALTLWFKLLTFINLNFWLLVNMLKIINYLVNYGVVLLLGVVSLMTGSTTGVLMSPGVWQIPNRNAAASNTTSTYVTTCCYITETPKYYTTKAPEYYTTTYTAPAYYTEAPITTTPEHRRTTLQPTLP